MYVARDEALQRDVAIKVLLQDDTAMPDAAERFLREARAMAQLSHPHVVTVHQVGSSPDGPYMVMELMEGRDVGSLVKDGPLPVKDALDVVRQAALGLSAAAAAGLVHRDVKPDNLFRAQNTIKVADFGLARPMTAESKLTQAGLIVGSPAYLAPELARGEEPTAQSDMYALGATFYELLVGRPPYLGDGAIETITAHLSQPVPDVRAARPDVPPDVAAIVARLLHKESAGRFVSYDELLAALAHAAAGDATTAATPAPTATQTLFGGPSPDQATVPSAPSTTSGPNPTRPATTSRPHAAFRSETLTVMFTDIAGYTERTGTQSREEAAHWLALHDRLLQPVMRAFGGKLIKTIGDALLITFKSPTDAVLCGMAMQDRLFEHNRTAGDKERIDVRVAISAGEVRVQRGDVFGEPVNVAARLEKHAKPGEVVFSDAVFAIMNTAEVPAEPRGQHQLKGIGRPVTIYAATPGPAGALPFGGRALARVDQALPVALAAAAPVLDRLRDPKVAFAAAGLGAVLVVGGLLASALGGDEHDPWIKALAQPDAEDAVAALVAAGDGDVDADLLDAAVSDDVHTRRHALDALAQRDVSIAAIEEQVGLLDLETGETCAQRRAGLKRLARAGKSQAALDAVEYASKQFVDNACMALDVWSVKDRIQARIEAGDDDSE